MDPVFTAGSNEPREVAITKYFTRTPYRPAYIVAKIFGVAASIGALVLLYVLSNSYDLSGGLEQGCFNCVSAMLLCFALLCGGVATVSYTTARNRYGRAWHAAEPKPTDAQVDAWHAADLARLKDHALRVLDLSWEMIAQDNPGGPLAIEGPGPNAWVKAGQDRVIRFSVHEVLVIFLTKYHLASYKATISLVDGLVRSESAQEYYYNDVVAVSTQTDNSGMTWFESGERRQIPSYQKFALSVASGEQISVAIRPNAAEMLRGNDMPESGSDKAIRAIRTRLREKKGGTTDSGIGADPSDL